MSRKRPNPSSVSDSDSGDASHSHQDKRLKATAPTPAEETTIEASSSQTAPQVSASTGFADVASSKHAANADLYDLITQDRTRNENLQRVAAILKDAYDSTPARGKPESMRKSEAANANRAQLETVLRDRDQSLRPLHEKIKRLMMSHKPRVSQAMEEEKALHQECDRLLNLEFCVNPDQGAPNFT